MKGARPRPEGLRPEGVKSGQGGSKFKIQKAKVETTLAVAHCLVPD